MGDPMPKSKCKGGGGLVEQTPKVLKDKPPPLALAPTCLGSQGGGRAKVGAAAAEGTQSGDVKQCVNIDNQLQIRYRGNDYNLISLHDQYKDYFNYNGEYQFCA